MSRSILSRLVSSICPPSRRVTMQWRKRSTEEMIFPRAASAAMVAAMSAPVRILHAHSTFDLGGKEARAVRLMNAFGGAAEHSVLTATGATGARTALDRSLDVDFPEEAPPLAGRPG